jgi:hypothetical protein
LKKYTILISIKCEHTSVSVCHSISEKVESQPTKDKDNKKNKYKMSAVEPSPLDSEDVIEALSKSLALVNISQQVVIEQLNFMEKLLGMVAKVTPVARPIPALPSKPAASSSSTSPAPALKFSPEPIVTRKSRSVPLQLEPEEEETEYLESQSKKPVSTLKIVAPVKVNLRTGKTIDSTSNTEQVYQARESVSQKVVEPARHQEYKSTQTTRNAPQFAKSTSTKVAAPIHKVNLKTGEIIKPVAQLKEEEYYQGSSQAPEPLSDDNTQLDTSSATTTDDSTSTTWI